MINNLNLDENRLFIQDISGIPLRTAVVDELDGACQVVLLPIDLHETEHLDFSKLKLDVKFRQIQIYVILQIIVTKSFGMCTWDLSKCQAS